MKFPLSFGFVYLTESIRFDKILSKVKAKLRMLKMEFLEIISSKIDKEAIVNLTCELIKERETNPPGNEYLAKNLYLKGISGVVHSPGLDSVVH